VIQAAFDDSAIATGENSDLIELSDERVAVIRVTAHYLPEAQPLEAVADEIRGVLEREEAERLAAEAATAFYDALGADESGELLVSAEALAAEHGATWNASRWIERSTGEVPSAIVSMVYAQAKRDSGDPVILRTAAGSGDDAVVLYLRAEPGFPEDIPIGEREEGQQQLSEQAAALEINAYAADARQQANVRIPDEILEPQF